MTDEQMLIDLAKTLRLQIAWWYDGTPMICRDPEKPRHVHPWNPLNDDGDAFRVAAHFGIAVSIVAGDVYAAYWSDTHGLVPRLRLRPTTPIDADSRMGWLRRAVVMCAYGFVSGANQLEDTP